MPPCFSSSLLTGSRRRAASIITHHRSMSQKPNTLWKHAQTAVLIKNCKSKDEFPESQPLPEVLFTGRSNAGKSTLVGAILGRGSLVSTSKKGGHTKGLGFYRVGPHPGNAVLVDTPGYGVLGRGEWGRQLDHYLETREQLKRVYVILNMANGLNRFDEEMLMMLSDKMMRDGVQAYTIQAVFTKADTLKIEPLRIAMQEMRTRIWEVAPLCLPPLMTCAVMNPPFGIDKLRNNVVEACGICP